MSKPQPEFDYTPREDYAPYEQPAPEVGKLPTEEPTDEIAPTSRHKRRMVGGVVLGIAIASSATVLASGMGSGQGETPSIPLQSYLASPNPTPTFALPPDLAPPAYLLEVTDTLKLERESFDPLYEPCAELGGQVLKQAKVMGNPEAKSDDETYDNDTQAVLTAKASEVRAAIDKGYTTVSLAFVPQDAEGDYTAEDAECAITTPRYLPVKKGKVWVASGIGKEPTTFSFVAQNEAGARIVIPTKLAKTAQPGDTLFSSSHATSHRVPLF